MEDQVKRLADKTWAKFQETPASNRLLIAIAGIPGSGKTSLAATVAKRLNEKQFAEYQQHANAKWASAPIHPRVACAVPLDGYHLTRKQLSEMHNAEEAIFRRGAAFTFDAERYLELVQKLRAVITPETRTIRAPSFDHRIKDPVQDDVDIPATARIVIFEGNYVALDRQPWRKAAELMDELWFVDVPLELATERLVERHVAAGISPNPEHARRRIVESDMRNGRDIIEHRLPVQEVIKSIEDEEWKPHGVKKLENGLEGRQQVDRQPSLAE